MKPSHSWGGGTRPGPGDLTWSIPCHFHVLSLRSRISLNSVREGLTDGLEERQLQELSKSG